MNEVGAHRVHVAKSGILQKRQLLQEHRPLTPRTTLEYSMAEVIVAKRLLDGCGPAGEIIGCQQAAMTPSRCIQDFVTTKEFVHCLGDEAAIPGVAGRIDAGFACRSGRLA